MKYIFPKIFRPAILMLVIFFFAQHYSVIGSEVKKIYLVYRFDDFSARSNTELELKIIEVFKQTNIPFTIGVIPYEGAGKLLDPTPMGYLSLPPEKAELLKAAHVQGVAEIALHGYAHQSHSEMYIGSEFRGSTKEAQFEKILKGKSYLEGISGTQINTFIPPWNQYDNNTLKVLEDLGFKTLSADKYGMLDKTSTIKLLPNSTGLNHVKQAVETARNSDDAISIIVALFHAYDFIEDKGEDGFLNLNDFSEIISWTTQQNDLNILTIDQLSAELSIETVVDRFCTNQEISAYGIKIPPYVRGSRNYTYASISYLNELKTKAILFYGIIFLVICLIGFFIFRKFSAVIRNKWKILLVLIVVVLTGIGYVICSHPLFGYNLAILLTIVFASAISLITVLILPDKKV